MRINLRLVTPLQVRKGWAKNHLYPSANAEHRSKIPQSDQLLSFLEQRAGRWADWKAGKRLKQGTDSLLKACL